MTKRVNEVLSIMEDYFTNYLPFVKGLSSNTIKSYQYAFQLLFKYLEAEKNISPEQISFQALSGDTISGTGARLQYTYTEFKALSNSIICEICI